VAALDIRPPVLHSEPLHLKVYSLMKDWITAGRLRPGERLRETTLASELGVSRTPVRDALRRLEQDRLIVSVPGPAYEVHSPTEQDLTDLFGARVILEGGAAQIAAERQPPEAFAPLTGVLEQMREAYLRDDAATVMDLDVRFHELVVAACENPVVVELHSHLTTRLRLVRTLSGDIRGRQVQVLDQHHAIVEALRSGSGAAAEQAIRLHILSVYRAVREAFGVRAVPRQ